MKRYSLFTGHTDLYNVDTVDKVDNVDSVGSLDHVDNVDNADNADNVDNLDNVYDVHNVNRMSSRNKTDNSIDSSIDDSIPFSLFSLFYQALQTIDGSECRHYSQIRYRFTDNVETTYRMGENPISVRIPTIVESSETIDDLFSCVQRPGMYVRATCCVSASVLDADMLNGRVNTFKVLAGTELREHWQFTTSTAVYHLSKVARGLTKHIASQATPVFTISIHSENPAVIHDLFGRFDVDGHEVALTIIPVPKHLNICDGPKSPQSPQSPQSTKRNKSPKSPNCQKGLNGLNGLNGPKGMESPVL